MEAKGSVGLPRAGIIGGCELSEAYWELVSYPLQGPQMLLIAELSYHVSSHYCFFKKIIKY